MKLNKTHFLQLFLFLLTIITTTLAGAEWLGKSIWMESYTWGDFVTGFSFSFPFLLILTVHEFGHYFTAYYHKVRVTLPYYIPLWFFGLGPSIGTMGAFIKIQAPIFSRKEYFDIGIAGPLAGFVVALVVLTIGFTTLPPLEYIYTIHPEYEQWGADYGDHAYETGEGMKFELGPNLLFWFFENFVADPERMPHPAEIIHYPLLFSGYLALFFTALNLLPIGQLDGGHIMYGMLGKKWHKKISAVLFIAFIFYAGLGFISPYQMDENFILTILIYLGLLYFSMYSLTDQPLQRLLIATCILAGQYLIAFVWPMATGYSGWLFFGFIIGRFLGVFHPSAPDERPLSRGRLILGWVAVIVFVLCFSPEPFIIE